jgi:hypothetical protein
MVIFGFMLLVENILVSLNKMITQNIRSVVAHAFCVCFRGLFEKHKLLFSFQMCIKKMQGEGRIKSDEYSFFLRGGQVMDRDEVSTNPCEEWIDDDAWDNISELDKVSYSSSLFFLCHSFRGRTINSQ